MLNDPMILFFTGPRKTGDLGRGAYTYDPIISYPISLHLREYPYKNWGSRQGAYTYDPIISFPIPLYLLEYPNKNWGSRQGLIRTLL